MGKTKDRLYEQEIRNPKNWKTRKCKHCGDNYQYSEKLKINTNEFDWCPNCINKIMDAD